MHTALLIGRLLGRALALGLGLLGALVVLVALRLAPGWGLLIAASPLATGLGCLALGQLVLHRRVRGSARSGIGELEVLLRRSRGRTGGAE